MKDSKTFKIFIDCAIKTSMDVGLLISTYKYPLLSRSSRNILDKSFIYNDKCNNYNLFITSYLPFCQLHYRLITTTGKTTNATLHRLLKILGIVRVDDDDDVRVVYSSAVAAGLKNQFTAPKLSKSIKTLLYTHFSVMPLSYLHTTFNNKLRMWITFSTRELKSFIGAGCGLIYKISSTTPTGRLSSLLIG